MGDKCKLMKHPERETSGKQVTTHRAQSTQRREVGDTCKLTRPKAPTVGDKRVTSVNSYGPRHLEWETSGRQVLTNTAEAPRVADKCERQVGNWQTRVADKCKLLQPQAPRVEDKGGKQAGDKCELTRPKAPRL